MRLLVVALILLSFSSQSHATSAEEVQKKTSEAASAAVEYTKEQKEEFQKDMEGRLAIMKAEIKELKESAAKTSGEAKKDLKQQIADLEQKQAELKKDLTKLKKSSGRAWGEMRAGMSKAWDVISDSYDKAKAEFKKEQEVKK